MLWVFYALICAFSLATADALSKQALATESVILITWVRNSYPVLFLLFALPFVSIPRLDAIFWKASLGVLPCDIIGLFLYMKAIKVSPLSLTLPFLSLTPVFLLGTSWLMLGEFPNTLGLLGILLIVVGAYVLNINEIQKGIFAPLKSIIRESGSLYMIGVAIIYSIGANLGKLAVNHSSPLFFAVYYNIFLGLVSLPILLFNKNGWRSAYRKPKLFLGIGFCIALMMITHFLAIDLTLVSYMISVKRMSLLFGVLYGGLVFKEKNLHQRLLGCFLMVIGVVLIVL